MKITKQFIIREIMGDFVIVPVGQTALNFNGMISTNETGAFIWNMLGEDCSKEKIVNALLCEFDVTKEQAEQDVDEFIEILEKNNIL